MQDNASIYSAKIIKEWLQNHGIYMMSWPPYLNSIEHAQAKLNKEQLSPTIKLFPGTGEELSERFTSLIELAWEDLGQDYSNQLDEVHR